MLSFIFNIRFIAIASFVILVTVQYFLVYNTFELKNDQFFLAESTQIKEDYNNAIRNDKVFPGGQAIIDSFLKRNIKKLEWLYTADPGKFKVYSLSVVDSIARSLRARSNVDSLMDVVIKNNKLANDLIWLSKVDHISITFNGSQYITLYDKSKLYDGLDKSYQNSGIIVSGSLKTAKPSSLVSAITISTPTPYSNRIGFSLYIDTPHRTRAIIARMLPTFLLSLFSVLSLATIFYITFRSWSKQKKLAEMKSDFVNSINHEFQTPLSAIIVANKTLEKGQVKENPEMVASLTGVIGRQAERLNSLFRQVIDITMMNESTLQKEPVIIEELLREVVDDYMIQADNSQVDVCFKPSGNKHTIWLDKFWVTTMIINIIENGVKYNTSTTKRVTVFTTENEKNLTVHIADNGVGIPADEFKNIFDKFYRNTKSIENKAVKGLGLGLYYTKQCIEAHRWQLHFDTVEKEGTDFSIIIPL
ncbi:MAG TPA: HAMP domain-containing sensor histidine kinase [Niabella sp.]|nr:HAMP domain-containing sensor histidine kinase [Niabella sp.]